jgi:predicted NAD/FAD-dependent oxidoreductase
MERGLALTVFDKGRRPGGRTNTREHDEHRFDHGAQYFTVRDDRIRSFLEDWIDSGVVEEWAGHLVRLEGNTREPAKESRRYVGVPDMIALPMHLASDVDVRCGVRVEQLERSGDLWRLTDDEGRDLGNYEHVIIAVPAPQAVPLLGSVPTLQVEASRVSMAPCWAAMFAFEKPVASSFDGAFVEDAPLSWIARDTSKPGRPDGARWVAHATPDWTTEHWDLDRGAVAQMLAVELERILGPLPARTFERAHRWGYALASAPAPGKLHDATAAISVVGDWTVGGRIEGALLSGLAAADMIVPTS